MSPIGPFESLLRGYSSPALLCIADHQFVMSTIRKKYQKTVDQLVWWIICVLPIAVYNEQHSLAFAPRILIHLA